MIRAELAEMDTLSRRLDTCSNEVSELKRALTTLIDTTTWTGRVADEFRARWQTEFNPALANIADALVQAGRQVDERRDMLDIAANR